MIDKIRKNENLETAVFGGGCFWGIEAAFAKLKGVESTAVGYAGGTKENPTYEDVLTKKTGHAETVKIEYDPKIISYQELLSVSFTLHDPTTLNRQGAVAGSQYRSIILYVDDAQKKDAEKFIGKLSAGKIFANPIVTEVKPLDVFYPAEKYHQKYFEKNSNKSHCLI